MTFDCECNECIYNEFGDCNAPYILITNGGACDQYECEEKTMKTIKKYVLFINDDNEGEFDTKIAAENYIRDYVRGTAETYGKTQKWVREHTDFSIEMYTFNVY